MLETAMADPAELRFYIVYSLTLNGVPTERAVTWIDKSSWGEGEWTTEPDKVQWTDLSSGLPCLAVREPMSGHWCGYAGVPPGHPAYGLDLGQIQSLGLGAHGGITFTGPCQEGEEAELTSVCHTPAPGQPEQVWWTGFDCAHAWDAKPAMRALLASLRGDDPPLEFGHETYRTLGYVQAECADLAGQLACLEHDI